MRPSMSLLFLSAKQETSPPACLEIDGGSLSSSGFSSPSSSPSSSSSASIQRGLLRIVGIFTEAPLAVASVVAATLLVAMLISFAGTHFATVKAWPPDFAHLWTNNGALFAGRDDEDEARSQGAAGARASVPQKSDSSSSVVMGGLVNYGNTCFLNSVVQSLASVPSMTEMLADSNAAGLTVSTILNTLLQQVNTRSSSSHTHSPAALLQALRSPRWTIHTEQQDAHEFLLALLDAVRTERVKHSLQNHQHSISISSAVHNILDRQQKQHGPLTNAPVILPFDGLLATRVSCLTCNEMQSLRQQPFSSIELSLSSPSSPSSSSPCGSSSFFLHRFDSTTLESLLENYTAPEILDNVYCQRCSLVAAQAHLERLVVNAAATVQQGKSSPEIVQILGARRDAIEEALSHPTVMDEDFERLKPPRLVSTKKVRQVAVARTPAALALHVNRSEYDIRSGVAKKKNTRVEFPERIRIGKYISSLSNDDERQVGQSGNNEWYRLTSTVIHFGSHSFGHYVAYRRVGNDQWIRASDRDVRETTIDEVLAQGNVVLLFYEREDEAPEQDKKDLVEKVKVDEEVMLRLETDMPIFDAHENDLGDGLDAYAESSSSSSAANSVLASPVRQSVDEADDVPSQFDVAAAAVPMTRRRRCSSTTSTITPVSDAREKQAVVMVN
ncbi:hypothetical protein V1517DRAFT_343573 [Lipomyces orientalis]|uniref:Uncharacterized protein n=1 Tax=Lipomyces orientalis TaxID=1233043 RepID=A0ACC3TW47_9ASCO